MKKLIIKMSLLAVLTLLFACKSDKPPTPDTGNPPKLSTRVEPVDINQSGLGLLENMQGHWIGTNKVMTFDWDWFAFDYRAISPSHVHGIYEGGSMGNLFTSFFVTDFKNTRTIMARNGGLLNGIYRTSYFVLDSVGEGANGDYYRLVDANAGSATMWMELRFNGDSLSFNSYTSGLGQFDTPTRHMTFRATREHPELAQAAAVQTDFPQNIPDWDFSQGFNDSWLYGAPNSEGPKSATFLAQDPNMDLLDLALASGDPFRIDQHEHIATLQVDITRNPQIEGKTLFVYLSIDPLTDANGYLLEAPFNTVLHFPELIGTQDQFEFTYLHPGDYYLTVIADANDDRYVSAGDITQVSQAVTLLPNGNHQISMNNITVQN